MTAGVEIAGWTGAMILLGAYALISMRRLAGDGVAFQLMNIAGSAGVAAHSGANQAWASVALNLVWIAVGLAALTRRITSRHRGCAP